MTTAKEKIQLRLKRLRRAYPELENMSDGYLLRYEHIIKQERRRVNNMIKRNITSREGR
jgi:hypothetical protein